MSRPRPCQWRRAADLLSRAARLRWSVRFAMMAICIIPAATQGAPLGHVLHASKAQVEKSLLEAGATGGPLPTLEGFVVPLKNPQMETFERYRRARYTYSVRVAQKPGGGSVVQVRAHITAWYTGDSAAPAGYRELVSNGRLENDLLDRLADLLKEDLHQIEPLPTGRVPETRSSSDSAPAPGKPVEQAAAIFSAPRPGASLLPPRTATDSAAPEARGNYTQSLRDQAANLEEILKNQTRPSDLAAVRQPRTPVYSRPSEQAEVLFLADARDEFQVLNRSSEWVHVQISGLSRGWIRGPALELPSRVASPSPPVADSGAAGTLPFRLSQQEVNTYPGSWAPLRGKSVRILSLEPSGAGAANAMQKWETAKTMFRRAADRIQAQDAAPAVEGVVLIFDAADGGMVSATLPALRDWSAGRLSDDAFRAQCSFDPPEAF